MVNIENEIMVANSHIKNLKLGILPSKDEILEIIKIIKRILMSEPNVISIEGDSYIFGDIHGQFFDLLNILNSLNDSNNIVFLGDYVDRGYNSVEVIVLLFLLKIAKRTKIFLLRGNHENESQTSIYGFKQEALIKLDEFLYFSFCETFYYLPLSIIINNKYFCIHGGLIPDLTVEKIMRIDRTEDFPELGEVMWSDPCEEIDFFRESQRGAGFLFGEKAINDFLLKNNFKHIVRSHQLVFSGFKEHFNGKCITVWSAPNYCYKCKNKATVMVIKEENHDFILFDAVDFQFDEKCLLRLQNQ